VVRQPGMREMSLQSAGRSDLRGGPIDLGARVRSLRLAGGQTIRQLSHRAELSAASISKIENNLLSPTYENIIKLARGLAVDIAELFSDAAKQTPLGRMAVTRSGSGRLFPTAHYDYEMLCTQLTGKKMTPLRARIKSRTRHEFTHLISHEGEEVLLVLSGKITLFTEYYEPIMLGQGDCVYFDSRMGHVCVAEGIDDAEVFWVCSSAEVMALVGGKSQT
jgi:transcriptional regulator with XRE-family HTH domain